MGDIMEVGMTKNAIIYVRVSSDRQVDGYSLDDQYDKCVSEAKRQGYNILKVYREEGVSAKTIERPQLEELMHFVQKNHKLVQALFFYHSSRLSRNTLDFLTLKAFFSKYGVSINSVTEAISGDSPETKFLATIMSAVNQLDNEIKGRNVRNAMRRRFMEGNIISNVPLGYRIIGKDGKSFAVRDLDWWDFVAELWKRMENQQLTILSAAKWLSSASGRKFRRSTIDSMLRNKFYCGYLVSPTYGETRGNFEAMVPEDTYYRVRSILEGRRLTKTRSVKYNKDFAVRGLLHCVNCGAKVTAAWSKGKKRLYPYYFCYSCENKVCIPRDDVENVYLSYLSTVKPTEQQLQYLRELMHDAYAQEYGTLKDTSEIISEEVQILKKKLSVLEEKHLAGIYSDEDYMRIRDTLKVKIASQESLKSEKKIDILNIDTVINVLEYYLRNFDQLFIKLDPESRYRIGCSINPKGIYFEDKKLRTPELGPAYHAISQLSASSVHLGTPYQNWHLG